MMDRLITAQKNEKIIQQQLFFPQRLIIPLIRLLLIIQANIYYLMISNQLINLSLLLTLLIVTYQVDCPKDADEFFVTFHPHLDAFWLDTDDDLKDINFRPAGFLYAMNQRNSKTIFNSMLQSLMQNQARKYMVSEVVFFKDWYEYLDQNKKSQVKQLFERGQLQIANGGWVQNDQAVCYIDDIIDQYTVGNNFLNTQFGLTTKIGWATDSFGHSHSQVAIQHLLGFQFQGIERIDDRYIYDRKDGPLLEFYWSPVSDSNNRKYGGVVTYVRHFLHQVNDLRQQRPESISNDFVNIQKNMKKLYKSNKYFRFLGNDFEEFIPVEFQTLQAAFQTKLNKNQECPVYKYGNPTDYLQKVKQFYEEGIAIRSFDFMPNFDQDHYWSGYYTTNPLLKKVCKDFSRLVNLFRKIYIKYRNNGGAQKSNIRQILITADQLLSVVQHHDGITATSKYHIETKFVERMKAKTIHIIDAISELKQITRQSCKLFQGSNSCQLNSQEQTLYFSIIHEGSPKKQRIQLILPKNVAYDVYDDQNDQLFCHPISGFCSLVFEPNLKSGQNVFILKKIYPSNLIKAVSYSTSFIDSDFQLTLNSGNQFTYTFNGDQFIRISFVKSPNQGTSTNTYTWNKYGNRINKNQNRMAGIYIMANTGQLLNQQLQIKNIYVIKGKVFTKIYLPSGREKEVIITIKNSQRNIIDLSTTFVPTLRNMMDYFIQVQTKVNSKGEFFHDSNGYLVIKRRVGQRPDYSWQYKRQDKINANTYPMCSFAYAIDGEKKLVIFTDRAQGVAQFDNTYLINIDRLTGDDYKGVGEGYYQQIQNTFSHRIALVGSNQFVEREWQRSFDQPLLAFFSNNIRENSAIGLLNQNSQYLKYTLFSLNADQYVLRLFNLAENQDIKLPIYSASSWKIAEIDLNLKYADIKQSFANGLILSERKSWVNIPQQINMFNAASKDTHSEIIISPLQVRSFRINLKNKIVAQESPIQKINTMKLTPIDVRPIVKPFAKRCF